MQSKGVKQKFILVIHSWFVDSRGFSIEEVECASFEEAEREASFLANKRSNEFVNTDFVVLPIMKNETVSPRRLSLWERLVGEIK